ncbi:MAG TPA: alpha/beta hydrolase [Nitrososphaeraceae archaeon]|nr:alpha/beta hydrolase [Nitrososphaeraceae archaeon]
MSPVKQYNNRYKSLSDMERAKKSLYKIILIMALMLIVLNGTGFFSLSILLTNAQISKGSQFTLPVILIHGYLSDASVWNTWQDLLKKDNISAYPITFTHSDDKCGSVTEHAIELSNLIGEIKKESGQNKVNIVGFSKGGLDARLYLANNTLNTDVANLIMIGTPNAGSPLANTNNICLPAVEDLRPGAKPTKAEENNNTEYYTIAGDWNPFLLVNCPQLEWLPAEIMGYLPLLGREGSNDGIVSISSVESLENFTKLGYTPNCHSNLLGEKEYELARNVLLNNS